MILILFTASVAGMRLQVGEVIVSVINLNESPGGSTIIMSLFN